MSRIGRAPITVPAGVTVEIAEGNVVTVTGKLGTLQRTLSTRMTIAKEGDTIVVSRPSDDRFDRAAHGLTRTLIANMIIGVSEGYQKKLEMEGVGYKAEKQGNKLVLSLGYSHPITFTEENAGEITFGDSNGDGIINAQDALAAVDTWLRKTDAPSDDEILALNVNSDSRINTFDALGIVEAFVDDSEYLIITKAATLGTNN